MEHLFHKSAIMVKMCQRDANFLFIGRNLSPILNLKA